MKESRLPKSGGNLFQMIKAMSNDAQSKGKKLLKLSIGQPSGAAALSARTKAAETVLSDKECVHEYQDNGNPGVPGFASRFVQAHVLDKIRLDRDVGYLPIPGIKPMLGLIPLACGANRRESPVRVMTTTDPGYPTPADWCVYLGEGVHHSALKLTPENKFRFDQRLVKDADLVMINYPHNPSGQTADGDWLAELCGVCQEHGVRLFNDGAYTLLHHSGVHRTLTDVSAGYPELSWAEAFSSSKLGNCTGWRIGAIAGSQDFVGDIATVKGNTDSGFFAPAAAGVLQLLEHDFPYITNISAEYGRRLQTLIAMLRGQGMELAVEPGAGFFSLWKIPQTAFGEAIKDAHHFNSLMIERTGIVGVHFHPYIRYSVAQADPKAHEAEIEEAFGKAQVSY